jgi:hypothetical protein
VHEAFGKRLNKVMALTAFGDPLYCEAIVTMHSYDIVLDLFIVNRTSGFIPRRALLHRLYLNTTPQTRWQTSALILRPSATCVW